MLGLFFLDSLGRVFAGLSAARWLSPFRYYDLSAPLPPGGRFDFSGFVLLLAIAASGIAFAMLLSTRRAGHASVVRAASYEPSRATVLTVPVARDLYSHRIALGAWCIAFAALGVVLVAATGTSMQDLLALPRGLVGLPQYIYVFYAQALGTTWFDVALLMFAALAFAFVGKWSSAEHDRLTEAALSAPYSRSALVVERMAALAVTAAVFAAASGVAVALTSRSEGLALDSSRLADACLLLLVFSAVVGAAGSLFVSGWPGAAPMLFGGFLLAAYLDDQIGGALGLPGWLQSVSPFRLADAPLAGGLNARSLALLLALFVAGVGTSILLMQRRDVGR
jgi:ABC-2 type transport system permease protein